jgi:hypothetical protein
LFAYLRIIQVCQVLYSTQFYQFIEVIDACCQGKHKGGVVDRYILCKMQGGTITWAKGKILLWTWLHFPHKKRHGSFDPVSGCNATKTTVNVTVFTVRGLQTENMTYSSRRSLPEAMELIHYGVTVIFHSRTMLSGILYFDGHLSDSDDVLDSTILPHHHDKRTQTSSHRHSQS